MAKEQPIIRINLTLRARKSIQSAFLKWAVSAGKLIIIGTELIALSALGYRFMIDKKIIDLHDEISNEIALIEVQKDREQEFRDIQNKLAQIKSIEDKNKIRFDTISKITEAISRGVFTTDNLVISDKRIQFEGASLSIFSIYNFIEELKSDSNILAITLDEVTSSSQGIRFNLTIDLAILDEAVQSSSPKKELVTPTN
ncbi:MAG: hypothetical protein KA477_00775 [Candidatus Levybacteria bacterium]|nr:hypothetical protein [Candidatus Levybacteria bacterium]